MHVETVGEGTPDVAVVGAVHGDEPCGARAIKRFLTEDHIIRKPAKFVIANERALDEGVRSIETDLNRALPGDSNSETHEERLADAFLKEITGCTTLGLHSTRSYADPFGTVADLDGRKREVLRALPISKVVDFSMVSDGRCVNLPGFVDVEAGFQGSEQAVRNAYECLVAFLRTNGVLSGSIQDTETTLYEVFDTVEKDPDSRYRFVRSNFEFVAKGTTFAKSDGTKLQAEQDFWPVLMSDDGHSTLFGYKTTLVGSLNAA